MSSPYPAGAGPNAGAFSGQVYRAPNVDPVTGVALDGEVTRPLVSTARGAAGMVEFTPGPSDAWAVHRILVSAALAGPARVYIGARGSLDLDSYVSGTFSGDIDTDDTLNPYIVDRGEWLTIKWDAGGSCFARIEYRSL